MAFREKSAWITLVCTLLVYGAYFALFTRAAEAGQSFSMVGGITVAVVCYVVLQIILTVIAAAAAPRDARAPEDEREHEIQVRARSAAFVVLQLAGILAVASVHFFDKWTVANAMFAALILAEVVRNLFVILGYRRGL